MKTSAYVMLALLLGSHAMAVPPTVIDWERLRDVQFVTKWYAREETVMLFPKFGPTVKALDRKVVTITGYIIPIDLETGQYVLSRFPVAACFFCGAAGPESIMALKFTHLPHRFRTDERRTFTGTLRLNATNVYELNYLLDEVSIQPDAP